MITRTPWTMREIKELKNRKEESIKSLAEYFNRTYNAVRIARFMHNISRKQIRSVLTEGKKTCTKCRKEKGQENFCKDKRTPDGLQRWCKSCSYVKSPFKPTTTE